MKNLKYLTFALSIFFAFSLMTNAFAEDTSKDVPLPVSSAKAFFEAMKDRSYAAVWAHLTTKSRTTIIDDVMKAIKKTGERYSREEITTDFEAGGVKSALYWDAFLNSFNPDLALRKSKLEMGSFGKNDAVVIMHYRRSEEPAELQMSKEENEWKVGLVETFWKRKIKE